jgi:histidyl-tRNA synthetase
MTYNIPKGVFDILPFCLDEPSDWKVSAKWQYLESVIRKACLDYGFQEIRTPLFEKTELFIRSSGETSDIVSKEMYTFQDKAERSMTLRPEGTASVMRSVLENKLYSLCPHLKLFYIGPIFRYDRPQAGRYRQHHQFGVEAIGCEGPEQDAEVIEFLCEVYKRLGLKNLKVQINSIGDLSSRSKFNSALRDFLSWHSDKLSKDSQVRLNKNPLRILDSKDPEDQKILQGAPCILDYLDEDSKLHFQRVLSLLEKIGISYVINPLLVRGLDYYNRTVFEVTSTDLGAQNTIGAGGRYDDLSTSLGGHRLPSVGFATGIERVLQTMIRQGCSFQAPNTPDLYILPLGADAMDYCFKLTSELRKKGIPTEMDFSSKKIQQGLAIASKLQAKFCLIVGDQEIASGTAVLKNMATREQVSIELTNCLSTFETLRQKP